MVTPKLTVLMPVYNAGRFLAKAMESILSQTFQDFEFLIIDDGSTDDSLAIIRSYHDARIRLYCNAENLGISKTLNRGIGLASCDLIARMDADDICNPFRLQKQYNYMLANPDCALLSSWARVITDEGRFVRIEPYKSKYYYYNLTFECWIYHPTVMFRKGSVVDVGMYSMPYSEDYDLFWKLSTRYRIANIPEALVNYRLSPTSLNTVLRKKEYDIANEQNVIRNIRYYMGDAFEISHESLECLRHNFEPLAANFSFELVAETLDILERITDMILKTENINRDEQAIAEAHFYKRQFIIQQLALRIPVMAKFMLIATTREWMIGVGLCMSFIRWQLRKMKSYFFGFLV